MKIEEGNGAWLLLNAEGDEIARRTCREELQAHLDRLSAARAVAERDADGGLIEHRATMTREAISAQAQRGAWAWAKHDRGAGRRKGE